MPHPRNLHSDTQYIDLLIPDRQPSPAVSVHADGSCNEYYYIYSSTMDLNLDLIFITVLTTVLR